MAAAVERGERHWAADWEGTSSRQPEPARRHRCELQATSSGFECSRTTSIVYRHSRLQSLSLRVRLPRGLSHDRFAGPGPVILTFQGSGRFWGFLGACQKCFSDPARMPFLEEKTGIDLPNEEKQGRLSLLTGVWHALCLRVE